MKSRITAFLPAVAILAAGVLLLNHQHRGILELKNSAKTEAVRGSLPESAKPVPENGRRLSTEPPAAAVNNKSDSDARAAAFLTGFREKARPLVEAAQRDAAATRARHKAGRIALLLGLNASDKAALQEHLERQTPPNIDAAAGGWIAQRHGEEAAAKYDAAESASRAAAVEHDSQDAIYRVSRIVDLTPEQKDRLFAGFVRKAAASPRDDGETPYDLRIAFSLQDTPSIENPASLARALLSPEQLAFFDAVREEERKAIAESTRSVMGQIVPALLGSLQEASSSSTDEPPP